MLTIRDEKDCVIAAWYCRLRRELLCRSQKSNQEGNNAEQYWNDKFRAIHLMTIAATENAKQINFVVGALYIIVKFC
jgi:hypothetical protein